MFHTKTEKLALPGLNIIGVKTKMRHLKFIYYRGKKIKKSK